MHTYIYTYIHTHTQKKKKKKGFINVFPFLFSAVRPTPLRRECSRALRGAFRRGADVQHHTRARDDNRRSKRESELCAKRDVECRSDQNAENKRIAFDNTAGSFDDLANEKSAKRVADDGNKRKHCPAAEERALEAENVLQKRCIAGTVMDSKERENSWKQRHDGIEAELHRIDKRVLAFWLFASSLLLSLQQQLRHASVEARKHCCQQSWNNGENHHQCSLRIIFCSVQRRSCRRFLLL